MALWTPKFLAVSCWWDAQDYTSLSFNGSKVSQISGQNGTEYHATNATDSTRPTYTPDGLNGYPAIRFAEGQTIGNSARNFSGTASVFYVQRTTDSQYIVLGSNSTSNYLFIAHSGNTTTTLHGGVGAPQNYWKNGQTQSWVDRGAVYTALHNQNVLVSATNTNFALWTGGLWLAGYAHTDWHFSGDIGEFIVVPGTLGQADIDRMHGYLAHKWGLAGQLPADHPYRHVPPEIATQSFLIIGGRTTEFVGGDDRLWRAHELLASQNIEVAAPVTADVLLIGGAGAGGRNSTNNYRGGGGGGAGGRHFSSRTLSPGVYPVVIGRGGVRGTNRGGSGTSSSFDGVSVVGGGAGGGGSSNVNGLTGGSGGGGGNNAGLGAAGTAGQGHAGANQSGNSFAGGSGGGGGGAGAAAPAAAQWAVNPGGVGITSSITGVLLEYARGGNGGHGQQNTDFSGSDPVRGGGGAGARFSNAQNGSFGVLILSYPVPWRIDASTHAHSATECNVGHVRLYANSSSHAHMAAECDVVLFNLYVDSTSHAHRATAPKFLFRPHSTRQRHLARWHFHRLDFVYRDLQPVEPSVANGGAIRFDFNPELPRIVLPNGIRLRPVEQFGRPVLTQTSARLFIRGLNAFRAGNQVIGAPSGIIPLTFRAEPDPPAELPLLFNFEGADREVLLIHVARHAQRSTKCNVGVRTPLIIQTAAQTQTTPQFALVHTSPLTGLNARQLQTALIVSIRHTIPLAEIQPSRHEQFVDHVQTVHRSPARAHSLVHKQVATKLVVAHFSPLVINKGTQKLASIQLTIRHWSRVVADSSQHLMTSTGVTLYVWTPLVLRNTRHLMRSMRLNFLPADWIFRAIIDIEPDLRILALESEERVLALDSEERGSVLEAEERDITIPAEIRIVELESVGRASTVER
jgi:hypothetical protein